jgi:hopene-associated glycosyltransferase HpnB
MPAVLTGLGVAALVMWAGVLLHPGRPWDLRPRDGEAPGPPEPASWPVVCVLAPAHDEAAVLPQTLPALLGQDYPGDWRVVLVDDRSHDGTGEIARAHASARLTVVDGRPLPEGWAGKVWALEQGLAFAGEATYVLLTDADIAHAPTSLRSLVAESEALGLALNSRMARLHVGGLVERLLVPPFVFFFALLYPMRWVNQGGRLAAAAGGCVLVRADALAAAGMFGAIRGAVIDDVSLASAVKRRGLPIRLATSNGSVRSMRRYRTLGGFWRTVRRTAFTQLRHSVALLALTVILLLVLFAAPPVLFVIGAATGAWLPAVLGLAAWLVASGTYLATVRLYGLNPGWALSLPAAGLLYGAMTVDSALRHVRGERGVW